MPGLCNLYSTPLRENAGRSPNAKLAEGAERAFATARTQFGGVTFSVGVRFRAVFVRHSGQVEWLGAK